MKSEAYNYDYSFNVKQNQPQCIKRFKSTCVLTNFVAICFSFHSSLTSALFSVFGFS